MGRVRTVDEWMTRLSTRDSDAREEALEALGELLGTGDAEPRERTARALLQELGRPGTTVAGPILFLLQRSWWPPQAGLLDGAVQAVMSVLPRLEVDAQEVEHAAMVMTNVCRVDPSRSSFLEEALEHPRPQVRSVAARVVGRVGQAALPWDEW